MGSNFKEMLAGVKAEIREVSVHEVNDRLNGNNDFTLIDIREKDEWDEGHLSGALFLPRGFLEVKVERMVTDKDGPILLYCAGGVRSALAAKSLNELGYKDVVSMAAATGSGRTTGTMSWCRSLSVRIRWRATAGISRSLKLAKKVS